MSTNSKTLGECILECDSDNSCKSACVTHFENEHADCPCQVCICLNCELNVPILNIIRKIVQMDVHAKIIIVTYQKRKLFWLWVLGIEVILLSWFSLMVSIKHDKDSIAKFWLKVTSQKTSSLRSTTIQKWNNLVLLCWMANFLSLVVNINGRRLL